MASETKQTEKKIGGNYNGASRKISARHFASPFLVVAFLFFSGVFGARVQAATNAAATFTRIDTATQGNWSGNYGSDGYAIANSSQRIPAYASFGLLNQLSYTWDGNTGDSRAPQTAPQGRIASCWDSLSSFTMDVNLTDGKAHQVAVYALDWDNYLGGRAETLQVVDANTNAVLDTRSISSFTGGAYLVWNITGHVHINATMNAGGNSVISGIFFSGATGTTAAATATSIASFKGTDTATLGNWQGKYGSDGYAIANSNQMVPSYAAFSPVNQLSYTWAYNTSDSRAPQTTQGRIASCWDSLSSFSFDVNLTDGKSHQVAVYALDWDGYMGGRSETLQVVDASSNTVLDTRSISSFTRGIYLVWNITGHVRINVIMNAGVNSVVSAIFFDATSAANQAAPGTATAPAITTQPVSQKVTAGQPATFSVADTGTAPITYQWMKNGAAISGATSSSYTTAATATSDNSAQFSVIVSNGAGNVTSATATLMVSGGTLILNASTSSLSFGNVEVSGSNSQTVTLTNAGTAAVTISNVSLSGAGFNAGGVSVGTILNPGQTASLVATFAPATKGTSTGSITVSSNATGGAKVIALSGTAVVPVAHTINLSWSPSTSAVTGYNVYVSTVSGSGYTKLTGSPVQTPGYADAGLSAAQTRYYVVTSVNSNNEESAYSQEVAAIVP